MSKVMLVIPTYNERENLIKLIRQLFSLSIDNFNILVMDDNSPDGTGDVAEELKKEFAPNIDVIHRAGKLGLGTAYTQGFQHCLSSNADIIGQMDADFSHPVEKIPQLLNALNEKDVAIGSRYIPGGSLDDNWPFWRKGLSKFGNFYARTILNLPIKDVTGGFRFWRATVLKELPLERVRSNGYVFQVEMAFLAHMLGFSFKEIPIYFAERTWGTSKMSMKIQVEAAYRVWLLKGMYRDIS